MSQTVISRGVRWWGEFWNQKPVCGSEEYSNLKNNTNIIEVTYSNKSCDRYIAIFIFKDLVYISIWTTTINNINNNIEEITLHAVSNFV